MKKLIYFLIPALLILSCDKDKDSSGPFTWNYDGTNYSANFKAAYSASMGQPYIIAGLGNSISTPNSGPRIHLISFSSGNYSFGGIVPNSLSFVDLVGSEVSAIGGSVNITSNSNKLSGNFSASLGNGKTVTGSFTDLIIQP